MQPSLTEAANPPISAAAADPKSSLPPTALGGPAHGVPPQPRTHPLARIRLALLELSGALRTCAEFVLTHTWEMPGLSSYDLASRAGVSPAAVNRLSRRIGYAGYREFSQALAMELGQIAAAAYALPERLTQQMLDRDGGGGADTVDEAATVVPHVLAMAQAALHDTRQSLDLGEISRAVRVMAGARQILFVSVGVGVGACEVAAYRFKVLGLRAACASHSATVIPEIHLLDPGDVVVGVSYHGHSPGVVDALAYARERELTTICITAAPGSPAAKRADIQLTVFGRDEALGLGQFASRVTTAALLEALATAVAWLRRDTAVPHANEVTLAAQRQGRFLDAPKRSRPRERQSQPRASDSRSRKGST